LSFADALHESFSRFWQVRQKRLSFKHCLKILQTIYAKSHLVTTRRFAGISFADKRIQEGDSRPVLPYITVFKTYGWSYQNGWFRDINRGLLGSGGKDDYALIAPGSQRILPKGCYQFGR
jgi:hypothetical protein